MKKHIVFDCDGTLIDTSFFEYRLYPGIKELLLELSGENNLYVWTARGRASTLRLLEQSGLSSFFQDISTPDDAPQKPHIQGLKDLVGDVPKHSVCVIGDSSYDIIGAKSFGVLSLGAVWSKEARIESLREAGADFIVSHPSECSKLIQLNLKGA
jgi:phosphoglycolate phosphatase